MIGWPAVTPPVSAPSADALEGFRPFAEGIAWNVLASDGVTIVSWVIDPENSSELCWLPHPSARSGYVVEGEVTFRFGDGRTETYVTGDRYAIPENAEYRQGTTDWTVLFDVYSPRHTANETAFETSSVPAAGIVTAMNEHETSDNEAAIRERAYFLWEQDGRPDGRHEEHWFSARGEHVKERDVEPIGDIAYAEAVTEARDEVG